MLKSNFFLYVCISILLLILLKSNPLIAMLASSVILITYITINIKSSYRFFLFLFPLIVYFLGFFYTKEFLDLGDNVGYTGPLKDSLAFYGANDNSEFFLNLQSLEGISYLKIGFLPVILIPDFLFIVKTDIIYYYFQFLYYLFLLSFLFYYINTRKVVSDREITRFIFFSILAPTIFLIGSTPSRTFFTMFSVFLFIFSFIDYTKNKDKISLMALLLSIIFTIISKQSYLIAYTLFLIYYYRNYKINIIFKYLFFVIGISFILFMFVFYLPWYQETSTTGLGNFNSFLRIPIIGPLSKYIFDIFAPFPHYKILLLSQDFYGGNYLFFILHIFSIITILIILSNLYTIYLSNKSINLLSSFGLIMTLTILPASAGFNGYIAIFYPLFSNYLITKNSSKFFFLSLIFLLFFNIFYFLIF